MLSIRVATVALLSCFAVSYVKAQCQLAAGDVNTLNYALTLEHLEAAFYNGLSDPSNTQISQAAFNARFPLDVYPYIQLIQQHENAHVNLITNVLTTAGCTAVPACNYTFSSSNAYASVQNFITTAYALESTGVSAYDGAVNTITDPTIRQVASTIATVEGRHASYLAVLNNFTPYPFAFDIANSSAQVYAIAGAFINQTAGSCSFPQTSVVTFNYVNTSNFGFQNPGPVNGQCGLSSGDISTLNYALALEHLEAAFYTQGLNLTNITDGLSNTTIPDGINIMGVSIATYLSFIRDHENSHVNYITNVFNNYGCNTTVANSPVPACGQYYFQTAFSNVSNFIATAVALEDTGVSAYDGAVNTIRDAGIRLAAATIHTVEARHAAFLRLVNSLNPFPNVTDIPLQGTAVLGIASGFINLTSCPVAPSGPAFSPNGVNFFDPSFQIQANATTQTFSTTQSATTATTTQSATTATTTQSATTAQASTGVQQTTNFYTTRSQTTTGTTGRNGATSTFVASFITVAALAAVAVLAV